MSILGIDVFHLEGPQWVQKGWSIIFRGFNPHVFSTHRCLSAEEVENLMAEIKQDKDTIHGFTLFHNDTKKLWQMSIRFKGFDGWSVNHIDDEDAQRILSIIERSDDPVIGLHVQGSKGPARIGLRPSALPVDSVEAFEHAMRAATEALQRVNAVQVGQVPE